jgi:predicted ATPase/DNA-binding winged helix-turn-helix (wHTH) protein
MFKARVRSVPVAILQQQAQPPDIVSFGRFRLYPRERLLKQDDVPVKLGSRAFDILVVLIEHAGEVVGHKELVARVWPGVFVEDISLRVHVAALRKILDGDGETRHLTTVPGRGYAFVAPVAREDGDGAHLPDPAIQAQYHLPPALARMVGRDATVQELRDKLAKVRFVSIVGPGGMGKTTVALAIAHAALTDFLGAVCLVELGALNDSRLLSGATASALGLTVQAEDSVSSLVAHLRGKRVLLIFDSSEHLISEVAALAEQLFEAAPELHILVTGREPLRAEGEHVHRLLPLESPSEETLLTAEEALKFPAVALFVQRVASSGVAFGFQDANAPVVAAICRKLGGIALAIELAAAQVGEYGLKETASLLDSEFALRWPGRRTAPQRHQTLNATLDWSYNLLSEEERAALRRLSVFAGGFTRDAAQHVLDRTGLSGTDLAVGSLVRKSLVTADPDPVNRYRLLDMTRTYAAMRLAQAGETETLRRHHCEYYRNLFQDAANGGDPLAGTAGPSVLDIDNVRAALHWAFGESGDAQLGVDLVANSSPIWFAKALQAEYRSWLLKADAVLAGGGVTNVQLLVQLALSSTEMFTSGISEDTTRSWKRALEFAETLGDVPRQVFCYLAIWGREIRKTLFSAALATATRSVDAAEHSADPGDRAMVRWMYGHTLHLLGHQADAQIHLERALATDTQASRFALITSTGYDRRVDGMGLLADTFWLRGYADRARQLSKAAVEEARALGYAFPFGAAMMWYGLNIYLSEPDTEAIEHEIIELVEHGRTHSVPADLGNGLSILGLCQARRGQVDAAIPLVTDGLRLLAESDLRTFRLIVAAHLSEAMSLAGRHDDARALLARAQEEDMNREHFCLPDVLRVHGVLAEGRGDPAEAQRQYASAIDLARRQGALAWELRAAMNLAKLHAAQGRLDEGIDLLKSTYGQFTEGFATRDLVNARELLDTLRSRH